MIGCIRVSRNKPLWNNLVPDGKLCPQVKRFFESIGHQEMILKYVYFNLLFSF